MESLTAPSSLITSIDLMDQSVSRSENSWKFTKIGASYIGANGVTSPAISNQMLCGDVQSIAIYQNIITGSVRIYF